MGISIFRLQVSDELFASVIEAIRLETMSARRFVTLSEVVRSGCLRIGQAPLPDDAINAAEASNLFGKVPITLIVRERWRRDYEVARDLVGQRLGTEPTARQMLAITARLTVETEPGGKAG